MTERIQKAIDVFLDAINNGTLAKGTCIACAVGNLVAHGMNIKIDINQDCQNFKNSLWKNGFHTCKNFQYVNEINHKNEGFLRCIEATDFKISELMQIEFAFETNTNIDISMYSAFSKSKVLI